jgi:hypothetical protein
MSQDFEAQVAADVATLIKTLGETPPEAFDYIKTMLKRQGLGE